MKSFCTFVVIFKIVQEMFGMEIELKSLINVTCIPRTKRILDYMGGPKSTPKFWHVSMF